MDPLNASGSFTVPSSHVPISAKAGRSIYARFPVCNAHARSRPTGAAEATAATIAAADTAATGAVATRAAGEATDSAVGRPQPSEAISAVVAGAKSS